MTEEAQSPLAEASPNAIAELFARDPETLTEAELATMVKELRKQREVWNAAEKNKKSKVKLPAAAIAKEAIEDLLKDL